MMKKLKLRKETIMVLEKEQLIPFYGKGEELPPKGPETFEESECFVCGPKESHYETNCGNGCGLLPVTNEFSECIPCRATNSCACPPLENP